MELSKTLTKKDCEDIIRDYNRMAEACNDSIECLQNLSRRINECANTVREMKESIPEINSSKRKLFREVVQKYLELHGYRGVFTIEDRKCDVVKIEYFDKDGNPCMVNDCFSGLRPCRTHIYWSEVRDVHNAIDSEIEYINHYILKKDN